MASKSLRGLTIEIGADTSELNDALDQVDKKSRKLTTELKEIEGALKLDPGNTELLAQKQLSLANAISNTQEKLGILKEAEKQVQKQFERGEVSQEQVRALRREIIATEGKLNSYKNAAKETEEALKDVGDEAEDAAEAIEDTGEAAEDSGDGFTVAKGALAEFVGNGLSSLVGAAKDAISSFFELAESTREYRNEMAKLSTSFESAGLSADAANKTYKELYGILGDEGAAVEAAQQLAKMSKDEADLAANTRILTGVMAEYGNSIPTEGLAEGMAATAAMGEVQGVLADALEWQGVNLEEFNEKLAGMSTEEERAAFIQEELTKLYGESADAYMENNSAVIEANKSQADLTATQAELGETLEPLTQKMTELKTKALQWLIDTGLPALQNGWQWVKDNIPTIVSVVGALTAAWLTFGGAQKLIDMWNKIVAASQMALNAVMSANPIGLIIIAITALVAAFIALWNNCEGFRNFWINLWEGIKDAAKAVADWFVQAWTDIGNFFSNLWETLKGAAKAVADWFVQAWDAVGNFFSGMWDGLVSGARSAWDGIKNTFSSVASFFGDIFSKAWQKVKDVFSVGGKIFDGIKEGIVKAFKTVVNGIIKGINKVIALPFKGLNGVLDTISGLTIAGITPFDWLTWRAPVPQIPELARGGVLEKGQVGLLEGDGAEAVVPLEQNTKWLSKVAEQLAGLLLDAAGGLDLERNLQSRANIQPTFGALESLSPKLDLILTAIENGHVLTIDGDALVGATANRMDNALGRRRALASRGAI